MKLERKQKILLTLIIIALAFLAWQLYDIFFASNVSDDTATISSIPPTQPLSQPSLQTAPATLTTPPAIPSITTTTTATTTPTPLAPPLARPTPLTTTAPSTTVVQTTTTMPQVPPPPVMRELTLQAPITTQQREYLQLVNRYQIIRMQRMLADEEAALYTSKAKVVELNQQISKITGTAVTNNLFGPPSSGLSIGYQLMYIDYQNGRWTATLNQSGRFIEVNAGTTLPDGARVIKIDQNGVVIRKWNRYYLLNFYGTTLLRNVNVSPPATRSSNLNIPIRTSAERSIPVSKLRVISNTMNDITPPTAPITTTTTTIKTATAPVSKGDTFHIHSNQQQPIKTAGVTKMSTLARHSGNNQNINQNVTTMTSTLSSNNLSPVLNSRPSTPTVTGLVPQSPTANLTGIPPNEQSTVNKNASVPATAIAAPTPKTSPPHPAVLTKPQVPLTPQQKTTVTQLESYLDHKKPVSPESYSTDEKHLLTLPGEYYTLQIMGSYKLSDLINFVREHGLKDKAYTFHTYYMDKDWYVLIYGVYKTEDEALNAIKTLPPEIQRLKPWVRTIASVVEAIKLNPKQTG